MSTDSSAYEPPRYGNPAPLIRILGWAVVAILAAFLINNVLTVSFGFPGAASSLSDGGAEGIIQAALYLVAIVAVVLFVMRSPDRSLRWDGHVLHNLNLYLIRAAFWAVFLIGMVDSLIAFLRVEAFLSDIFGTDMAKDMGRAVFVGSWIHVPLVAIGFVIALFSRTLGFTWLALLIVAAELVIVITRFVFSYEQALMGDLVRYWYAALFLFASAYTLFDEGHVRVDVLYSGFRRQTKGYVNAFGAILLGMSTCWVIIWIGFDGKQSIINSPVANFEITQTGGTGMFIKYQMAAFLGIFAITMLIQFVSYFFEAIADYRDEPGHREIAPVSH